MEACQLILDEVDPANEPNYSMLSQTLTQNSRLWCGVLSAQHYGVVYLASRIDTRSEYSKLTAKYPQDADITDNFLRSHNNAGTRAINYAVHAYILRGGLRVEHATSCVPPNAISAVGPNHVVIRAIDFVERSPLAVLAEPTPMWDLHDFAHLTCATLCSELFGNKYQSHLLQMSKPMTALVRSPGLKTAKGPKISDGLVFSELLIQLFTDTALGQWNNKDQQDQRQTYTALTEYLAKILAEYYLGKRGLQHLTTGQILTLDKPISAIQLAVLVQNKSYELPASEIEQRVFTRGGPVGAAEDNLLKLTARERLSWLAESSSWGYFEVRNTIKHGAHEAAYKIVCDEMLSTVQTTDDLELLKTTRDNLLYKDWEMGRRVVLWDLVKV